VPIHSAWSRRSRCLGKPDQRKAFYSASEHRFTPHRKQDHEGRWPPKGILSGKRPPRHGIKLDSRANAIVTCAGGSVPARISDLSFKFQAYSKVANLGVRLVTRCSHFDLYPGRASDALAENEAASLPAKLGRHPNETCSDKHAVRVLMHRRGAQRGARLYAL
jgi:hypothetical protein